MRRKTWIPLLASAMVLGMSLTAFAGTWKSNGTGWWYENADGSYLTGWNWVDGNGDGIAESYYFQNSSRYYVQIESYSSFLSISLFVLNKRNTSSKIVPYGRNFIFFESTSAPLYLF